jgi:hypothetical protein
MQALLPEYRAVVDDPKKTAGFPPEVFRTETRYPNPFAGWLHVADIQSLNNDLSLEAGDIFG